MYNTVMGLSLHDLSTMSRHESCRLCMSRHRYLMHTRDKQCLSPIASSCEFGVLPNMLILPYIKFIGVFVIMNISRLECPGMSFHMAGNIMHMHQSMNDFPSITSTARLSILSNQEHLSRIPTSAIKGRNANDFATPRS